MSDFNGIEYNYEDWPGPSTRAYEAFKHIAHAGSPAIDFTLPSLDGDEVTLSSLKGKPVVIEFGAIT